MTRAGINREDRLYRQAVRILKETNPYKKDISELYYHSNDPGQYGRIYELCGMVKENITQFISGGTGGYGTESDHQICFNAIGKALVQYADSYPSSASFKMRMRDTFAKWMETIAGTYPIEDKAIPEALYRAEGEKDMLVSLLKALHNRNGVTKKELRDSLGIHPRSVMKNIARLDPEFSEDSGEKEKAPPYTLGGQRVEVRVRAKKLDGRREYGYRTVNTLHPLVLLENIMQAGTLLKALEKLYYDEENEISTGIAIDIWSQLSDYGKDRIKKYYFHDDPVFLEVLEDETPDDHAVSYRTEREILEDDRLSPDEKILFYLKAGSRRCARISLDLEEEGLGSVVLEDAGIEMAEKNKYRIRTRDGRHDHIVKRSQILDID